MCESVSVRDKGVCGCECVRESEGGCECECVKESEGVCECECVGV